MLVVVLGSLFILSAVVLITEVKEKKKNNGASKAHSKIA